MEVSSGYHKKAVLKVKNAYFHAKLTTFFQHVKEKRGFPIKYGGISLKKSRKDSFYLFN